MKRDPASPWPSSVRAGVPGVNIDKLKAFVLVDRAAAGHRAQSIGHRQWNRWTIAMDAARRSYQENLRLKSDK